MQSGDCISISRYRSPDGAVNVDSSILITIISCDYLNLSLANEYVDDVTIPTQVIKYNQTILQADQPIRLQYSNKISRMDNRDTGNTGHTRHRRKSNKTEGANQEWTTQRHW
jgi:hypothetical protein